MSLSLFLLRHGETRWNREGRSQGWTFPCPPADLSELLFNGDSSTLRRLNVGSHG